ncbi:MAG TPA: LPS export ABC transporter periplasmic protein LptC [Gemmatimonadales bacterium]|nr:LPS export ABC transporter periplasmic protein LptC [Gemmatimonadales bacterium]
MIRQLAVAALVIALAACSQDGARPTATISAVDTADQVLVGFSHYVTRNGIRRSLVEADTAFVYEPTQTTEMYHVRAVFYDDAGAIASTMTARKAVYHVQTGSMDAEGNVVVATPDGRRLASERLSYDKAADQLSTDAPFTYDNGTEHLQGTGFQADPGFKHVITNQPRGTSGGAVELPGQ